MADELKIWALRDGNEVEVVESVESVVPENTLEEILVRHPEMLEAELQLVGRQMPTAGGPLDLLGVDSDGRLVVYELKRSALTREAVTQCIDYASALDNMELGELAKHITERAGKKGIQEIDNFEEWYQESFGKEDLGALRPPRLVLVGLGVDHHTERMARFLRNGGIDISVLTFHGFQGTEELLARRVEVDHGTPIVSRERKSSAKEREEELKVILDQYNLSTLFDTIYEDLLGEIKGAFRLNQIPYSKSIGVSYIAHTEKSQHREICRVSVEKYDPRGIKVSLRKLAINWYGEEYFRAIKPRVDFKEGSRDYSIVVDSLESWDGVVEYFSSFMQGLAKNWNALRTTPAPKPN